MIFAGFRQSRHRVRNEIAHGQDINHQAIQCRVCYHPLGRHNVPRLIAWRLYERELLLIDAELVVDRVLQITLGIDRADQMIVKIATLRHFAQEGFEQWRSVANRFQIVGSSLLRSLRQR